MTSEREQFTLETIRFDVRTLNDIMIVSFVGLNLCDKSKEQGYSGAFARLRTKA